MNIAGGKLLTTEQRQTVLEQLSERVMHTIAHKKLSYQTVIDACDQLSMSIDESKYLRMLIDLGFDRTTAYESLMQVKVMLRRDSLLQKICTELGEDYSKTRSYTPLHYDGLIVEQLVPLGVLLHIAAGNADGLPVFSVIEGLLTGNINILKLPEIGDPISGQVLLDLLQIEPALADYVYVFDIPSTDTDAMKMMADAADAVIVWGSDAAVSAVRQLVHPNTKIIEWGHKVSFAYATMDGINERSLRGLAQHIRDTNQLLCSSCQGIFVDTETIDDVYRFCETFLPILDEVGRQHPFHIDIGLRAQITLQLQNESLETLYQEKRIFRQGNCSVIASADRELTPGFMYRNCWVKPLPRKEIVHTLKPYKNHLQTVGLLCAENERAELAALFVKAGIVRVMRGKNMSAIYCGSPRDGEYALRRYTKIVSYE